MDRLIVGVPSKGRLMEDTLEIFRTGGFTIVKTGDPRGYRGVMDGVPEAAVEFSRPVRSRVISNRGAFIWA